MHSNEIRFLNTNSIVDKSHTFSKRKGALVIAAIAYNNLNAIKHQIRLIKKYLEDSYEYIVVDNSSDDFVSQNIRDLCLFHGIEYIKLPYNPYSKFNPSYSHGLALQWFLKNIVLAQKIQYFGLIDHDIYPVRKTSLLDKLHNSPCYGHVQHRGDHWYLWPGFCFFNALKINVEQLNFLPVSSKQMDTGGGNYAALSNVQLTHLETPEHSYIRLTNSPEIQNNSIELIGDWAHTYNASGWMKRSPEKIIEVDKYLNSL